MMIKIAVVCVNYNSYNETDIFLDSLEAARKNCDVFQLDVFLADNSSRKQDLKNRWHFNFSVQPFPNIGYFGAAFKVINSVDAQEYDYIFISNVDVCIAADFFDTLVHLNPKEDTAWIAPQIYSNCERRDKNPQRLNRPSARRIRQLLFLYSHPFIMHIYEKTLYRRKIHSRIYEAGTEIYCGHGSFIILTKKFFEKYAAIEYPCFLYCEELFLGELIKNAGLKVVYEPSLKVIDDEHISTGLLSSKASCAFNLEALRYIYKMFYMHKR